MQVLIDMEKDDSEDLRIICELIKRKIPYVQGDTITENYSKGERIILAIVNNLIQTSGPVIFLEDIHEDAKNLGYSTKDTDKALEFLKKRGEIFEVREGFIKKI